MDKKMIHFTKNGSNVIETNWRTLAAIFSIVAVIFTVGSWFIAQGISYGKSQNKIENIQIVVTDTNKIVQNLSAEFNKACERIATTEAKVTDHEKRLDKLER